MRSVVGCLVTLVATATGVALPGAARHTAHAAATDCRGVVYVDLDADGTRREALTHTGGPDDLEPGIDDVLVRVTDHHGRTTSARTGDDGTWTMTVDEDRFPIRIDVATPDGLVDSVRGPSNGTSRQFVDEPADCGRGPVGSVGLIDPERHCEADATIVVACAARADAADADPSEPTVRLVDPATRDTRSTDATEPDGWLTRPTETLATVGDIGTVHGLAAARDGRVFAAAFVKRHTELRSRLNPEGNPTVVYELADDRRPRVLAVLDPTATDPHHPGGADVDHDAAVMDDVFRSGIGDLELSADGERLYAVDLGRRRLVTLDPEDGRILESTPLDGIRLGVDGCAVTGSDPFGDLRPFGLGLGRSGELLLGVVCSGASTVSDDDLPITEPTVEPADEPADMADDDVTGRAAGDDTTLIGYVFEYRGGRFRERLSWPLAGRRAETAAGATTAHEAAWHPWVDEYPFAERYDVVSYPQPAITDLVVDADGDLVVALGDRWSHQTAPNSVVPSRSGGVAIVESIAAGDLQRACANADGWEIEGHADCPGGIGDGWEFFHGDRYGYHGETPLGGLATAPGHHDVVATQMNPVPADDTWHSGGLAWHDTRTGDPLDGLRLYDGRSARPHGTFEQAAGTGDVEVRCGRVPSVLGGRIWYDADHDGVGDAGEPGIGAVTVALVDPYERVLARARTDESGAYEFDERDLDRPLTRGVSYRIVVPDDARRDGPFGPTGAWTGLRPAGDAAALEVTVADADPVRQRLDLAMVDQYDLALHATVHREEELDVLRLELVVLNQGSLPSGAFAVESVVPAGSELVDVTGADVVPTVDGDRVRWQIDAAHELPPGASMRLPILVRVAARGTTEPLYAAQLVAADGVDDDSIPGNALLDLPGSLPRFDAGTPPVDRPAGAATEDDAGALVLRLTTIAGSVWFDDDRDARRDLDPLEERAPGVEVRLLRDDGTEYARTDTDEDGWFEFALVEDGTYRIELPPESFTGPLRGHDVVVRPDGSLAAATNGFVSEPIELSSDAEDPVAVTHLGVSQRPTRPLFAGAGPFVLGPASVLVTWALLNRQRRRHRYGPA